MDESTLAFEDAAEADPQQAADEEVVGEGTAQTTAVGD